MHPHSQERVKRLCVEDSEAVGGVRFGWARAENMQPWSASSVMRNA